MEKLPLTEALSGSDAEPVIDSPPSWTLQALYEIKSGQN